MPGLSLSVSAQDFAYTATGNFATITGYNGPGGEVVISSTIDGNLVVLVGNMSFSNQFSITSVTIPNSVSGVGFAGGSAGERQPGRGRVSNVGDGHPERWSG